MTWIAALILALVCLLLLFGIALMRISRRADEAEVEMLREFLIEAILNRLNEVYGTSGRRYFASPESRRELEQALREVVPLEALIAAARQADARIADAPVANLRRFRRRGRFSRARRRGAPTVRL